MSAKIIALNETISIKDSSLDTIKEVFSFVSKIETHDFSSTVSIPTVIATSIVGTIVAVGVVIFNHRPKCIENLTANYINAISNQRIRHYTYDLHLGWKWFPWGRIKWTKHMMLKYLPKTAYHELTYEVTNNDDKFIPQINQRNKPKDEPGDIGITGRSFFLEKHISKLFLKTWEPEESDYKNRINVITFPDPNNPTKMVISNNNPVDITDYNIDLTKQKTEEFIQKYPQYREYLLTQNQGNLSDCYIENDIMHLVLSKMPKYDGISSGRITILLN